MTSTSSKARVYSRAKLSNIIKELEWLKEAMPSIYSRVVLSIKEAREEIEKDMKEFRFVFNGNKIKCSKCKKLFLLGSNNNICFDCIIEEIIKRHL